MANIAPTYQNLGEYTKAENLNIKVLDARKRVLGVEHPDTIKSMANLASTYKPGKVHRSRDNGDPSL